MHKDPIVSSLPHSLALAALIGVACEPVLDGPTPVLKDPTPDALSVEPPVVCQEQHPDDGTPVVVHGNALAPAVFGLPAAPSVQLPSVTLVGAHTLQGDDAALGEVVYAGLEDGPNGTLLRWQSAESIAFLIKDTLAIDGERKPIPTGVFDVVVENAGGAKATSRSAFAVTPRPSVVAREPAIVCEEGGSRTLVLESENVLRLSDTLPSVRVGDLSLVPALDGCEPVAHPGVDAELCSSISVEFAPEELGAGLHTVVVENPPPATCTSAPDDVKVAVVPAPRITAVEPSGTCEGASGLTDLRVTGTSFLRIDGTSFTVRVGGIDVVATQLEGCASVGLADVPAELCTSFHVAVDTSALPAGGVEIVVENPPPADCQTSDSTLFVVVPAPEIAHITPAGVCALSPGAVDFVVEGSGFLRTDTEPFTVTVNGVPVTPSAAPCSPLELVGTTVEQCTAFAFSFDTTGFAEGTVLDVGLTNPTLRSCTGEVHGLVPVTGPPVVLDVIADTVCSGVPSTRVELVGTGLTESSVVTIDGVTATTVEQTPTGSIIVDYPAGLPAGTLDIAVSNGGGCDAVSPSAITVDPSPLVFFVDPPIVFNGIQTEVTIFASDVTEDITAVELIDSGGNLTPLPFGSPGQPQRILASVPAALAPGAYEVEVTSADGCRSVLRGRLSITDTTSLDLTSVDPVYVSPTVPTAITVNADPGGDAFVSLPRVYLTSSTAASGNATAIALRAVELFGPTSLSAVVAGAPPGTYNLIVVNPSGEVGFQPDAVVVNASEPPLVTAVAPGSLDTNSTTQVVIRGTNFSTTPAPTLAFDCVAYATGATVAPATGSVSTTTATELDATINTSGVPAGSVCVVTVVNGDGARFRYSAISVRNPAQNLAPFVGGAAMTEGRRAPVLTAGRPTGSSRFVYAVGGDGGTASSAKRSVEAVAVDAFGALGTWTLQRNALPAPRTLAGGASVGRFVYIVGGNDGTGPVSSVVRAQILDPLAGPEILDLDAALGDGVRGLGAGLYLYRVSALFPATDASNPGGESLAGELFNVDLPAVDNRLVLTLTWAPVVGARGYRVYRTPEPGQTAEDLELLVEVTGGNNVRFVDDGSIVLDSAVTPLPAGSLGVWHEVTPLPGPRAEPATVAVPTGIDGQFFLYAVGGQTAANAVTGSGVVATITVAPDGSQTISPWRSLTASLNPARRGTAGLVIGPDDTTTAGTNTFLFFACGDESATGPGTPSGTVEAAILRPADGDISAFTSVSAPSGRRGSAGLAANGFLFLFGGQRGGTILSSGLSTQLTSSAPSLANWESLGRGDLTAARLQPGAAQESAFFFVAGGMDAAGNALSSTERTTR